jgi:hypothetical protein
MNEKKPTWKQKALALRTLGTRINMDNDGCSSAPDFNFRECCEEHDYYYRNDISVTGVSRSCADKRLRKCISKKWKLPLMPWVYWAGVRLCGWIPWNKNQKKIDTGELRKYNKKAPMHAKNKRYNEEDPGEWFT